MFFERGASYEFIVNPSLNPAVFEIAEGQAYTVREGRRQALKAKTSSISFLKKSVCITKSVLVTVALFGFELEKSGCEIDGREKTLIAEAIENALNTA